MISVWTFMVMSAISCPNIKVVDHTKSAWTDQDQEAITQAQKRCGELFPKAPCLKLFVKVEEGMYRAICGAISRK
jgi:hypothetical protein